MKKIISIVTISTILTFLLILSCDKDEILEPDIKTNKLTFNTIKLDSVGYRNIILSYQTENIDLNEVTEMGIVWNKNGEPTKKDSLKKIEIKPSDTVTIKRLENNTKYYLRFYSDLGEATKYEKEKSFTTKEITLAEVETANITNITAKSATSGGEILDKNGGIISACGVCLNKNGTPTLEDTITSDSLENLTFTSNLDSLKYNTSYYVRAYATNEAGTAYGNQISFTTENGLAEITTKQVTDITSVAAKSGGSITDNGGYQIISRGVCWSKSNNPETDDEITQDGQGTGDFNSNLSNLDKNSTYYVRAYASNEAGTAYGNENQFTTNELNISVTTNDINSITAVGAEGGGNILNNSSYPITEKGLCWNTTGNPTIVDYSVQEGSGDGSFSSTLSGLNYETFYYVRAYATNDAGTVYGEEKTFTTLDGIPSLTTSSITNITPSSAESGGEITNNEGLNINSRGVCWNTTGNPVTSDNNTSDGTGTGTFISSLTNLNLNTTYYVRAYATTDAGTGYGDEKSFTVGGKPTVTTAAIVNINGTSAEGGGDVTDNGGFSVSEKGICWSTAQDPTIDDNHTNQGTGTGSFTSSISGLSTSTTYYVRAYATNDAGTSYGDEISFSTTDGLPVLTTNEITNIDTTSANSGGNITDNGGFSITARGVCWSTSQNPTISDSHTSDGTGTGSYTSEITGLAEGTTYYVRAYAANNQGTSYGAEKQFTTNQQMSGTFTDPRDGQKYNWVRIGNKDWMAENLNYDQNSYGNDWCYENSTDSCNKYGRLYDWAAVMQGANSSNTNPSGVQGVCPDGWHVPSDDEWVELINYVADNGYNGTEGTALKSSTGWNEGGNGTDIYGFAALPGGLRNGTSGNFYNIGYGGYYWSATEEASDAAWQWLFDHNNEDVSRNNLSKNAGISVRCVRE
jgi:uncharacterized protein (TIGR02145 family)